ncbi:hypothetical protein [Marinigracilibium pacificum]|uniref:YD repeat-containing protein n=1 Tax=Marinigracilibium pacificum TaxID=2729599 RepID=A0A848J765_9BACT|nr:hypothetical protein [Marinigracilibium pacificum]NMM48952.1 hypothetical protein [Marinigracilibium pacificum]
MRFFYFLPLLFILTACPFSSDEDIAPQVDTRPVRFVEGADTTTIKISNTESFNLNNFLVCFEQIVGDDYYMVYGLEHTFENEKVLSSLYLHQYKKPYNKKDRVYEYTYDESGVITMASNSYEKYYDFEFDEQGLITSYTKLGHSGNVSTYDLEYDKYLNIISDYNSEYTGPKSYTRIYDENNNLIKWGEEGYYISIEYDNYNRPIIVTVFNKEVAQWRINLSYNNNNQLIEEKVTYFDRPDNVSKYEFEYLEDQAKRISYIFFENEFYISTVITYNVDLEVTSYSSYSDKYISESTFFNSSGERDFKVTIYDRQNDLNIIGYGISTVDQQVDARYTKEGNIYNANGDLLYRVIFDDLQLETPNPYPKAYYDSNNVEVPSWGVSEWVSDCAVNLYMKFVITNF